MTPRVGPLQTLTSLLVTASAALLTLGACTTTLPEKAGAALGDLSKASLDAVDTASLASEQAARRKAAQQLGAGEGALSLSPGCIVRPISDAPGTPGPGACYPIWTSAGGAPAPLNLRTPQTRAIFAAIADYGKAMAELSAAADVSTAQQKVDAVAKSISALSLATGYGALAAPIIDAASLLPKSKLVEDRRRALIEGASAMQPRLDRAVTILDATMAQMRQSIVANIAERIAYDQLVIATSKEAQQLDLPQSHDARSHPDVAAISRLQVDRAVRETAATDLMKATDDLQLARTMKVTFNPLTQANRDFIAALQARSTNLDAVEADVAAFLKLGQDLDAATGGKAK